MKKIIISEHISLDGFVAGPKGEIDWVKLSEEQFDLVGKFTSEADTALYGRITYQMMDSYWPNAADKPGASKHDKEHSDWYNNATKAVLSTTLAGTNKPRTKFLSQNVAEEIKKIKQGEGKNILVFGSPSTAQLLAQHNLADEYWLFINPIILGKGIPLFNGNANRASLKLLETVTYDTGVVGLHYEIKN